MARDQATTVVERRSGTSAAELLDAGLDQLLTAGEGAVALVAAAKAVEPDAECVRHLLDRLAATVLDLDGERATALPEGSVLQDVPLPIAWLRSGLRVVITTVATDAVEGFLGVCSALAALLPQDAPVPRTEAVVELLRHAPPHLVVVDATAASDGCFGSVRPSLRDTGTVLASTDALAADEALASLMGEDPAVSRVVRHALAEVGLAARRTTGDVSTWAGWRRAAPVLVSAAQRAEAVAPWVGRVLDDVASGTPADADDVVLRWARRWIGPLVVRADDDASPLAAALEGVTCWAAAARAWSAMLDKSRVPRRRVSLGLDLGDYGPDDYAAVADYMAPLMHLADAIPTRPGGLRWRRHGQGVLFLAERHVDAPFDAFTARVDVSKAIRLMNDYIGGVAVVVARDDRDRVLRQAERNMYLPQPNYLTLYGGEAIDVCKLEHVRYDDDGEHVITWRTVRSPNRSAVHDDGAVVFRDVGGGRTHVQVYGLQQFVLPPFWQSVDLTRYPALHDALTNDAYGRFFAATLDRFEARYEGRDEPIGHEPWVDHLPPTARVSQLVRMVQTALAPQPPRRPPPDADGFVHGVPDRHDVPGAAPASSLLPGFADGLRRALACDAARAADR